MKNYRKAKKSVDVSVGESVRIMRELQELNQNELSKLTGLFIKVSGFGGIFFIIINLSYHY